MICCPEYVHRAHPHALLSMNGPDLSSTAESCMTWNGETSRTLQSLVSYEREFARRALVRLSVYFSSKSNVQKKSLFSLSLRLSLARAPGAPLRAALSLTSLSLDSASQHTRPDPEPGYEFDLTTSFAGSNRGDSRSDRQSVRVREHISHMTPAHMRGTLFQVTHWAEMLKLVPFKSPLPQNSRLE